MMYLIASILALYLLVHRHQVMMQESKLVKLPNNEAFFAAIIQAEILAF